MKGRIHRKNERKEADRVAPREKSPPLEQGGKEKALVERKEGAKR